MCIGRAARELDRSNKDKREERGGEDAKVQRRSVDIDGVTNREVPLQLYMSSCATVAFSRSTHTRTEAALFLAARSAVGWRRAVGGGEVARSGKGGGEQDGRMNEETRRMVATAMGVTAMK